MTGTDVQNVLSRTVRLATPNDADEIARLCESTPASVRQLQAEGDFLVLDGPGGNLAGAVYLSIDEPHARIEHLNVAPEFASSDLPARLIAIAELMAEASGCDSVVRG